MRRYRLIVLCMSLLIGACASAPSSLVGRWMLTAYGSKDAPTPAVSDSGGSLTFGNDGTVGGSGGCNSLGGTYELDGDQITFSDITSTLMACDDARMAQERAVTQVLTETAQYAINGNTLTLTNADTVLIFSATSYP